MKREETKEYRALETISETLRHEKLRSMASRANRYMSAIRNMTDMADLAGDREAQDATFLALRHFADYGQELTTDITTGLRHIEDAVSAGLQEPEAVQVQDDPDDDRPPVEDKQQILFYLLLALQLTREYCNLEALDYDAETETVKAVYNCGSVEVINVACDSGIAMIRDVLRGLE